MPTNPTTLNIAPIQSTSPEEDATLQAIEALEAITVDLHPKPLTPATPLVSKPTPVAITPPLIKQVIGPVVQRTPVVTPAAPPAPATSAPAVSIDKPFQPPSPPKHRPSSPAEAIAEELANAPPTSAKDSLFQPFLRQLPSKKRLVTAIIIGSSVVVLATAGYFVLRLA